MAQPRANRAVAYVRMSTEHQQYSTQNQFDRLKEFAVARGLDLVRVFADEGKSGLSVKGREKLQGLIAEVTEGRADFDHILVYDVSRWGRFQDADESGYYEYLCRRAGITVHYCAEQFENDGSPTSNIIKSVKRSMAGEYSRELSNKVFRGACRLIQLGFKQGGSAGFGLRRMMVDSSGQAKQVLERGEYKSLQTDRVVLVPGPEEEQAVVRWIYAQFVSAGASEQEIACSLNARGLRTDLGRPWTRGTVRQVLSNEKYIGNNVYHRTSFKLKRRHISNPQDMWVRADGAFGGIVDPALFRSANEIMLARSKRFTDDELIGHLRSLYERHGRVSGLLIDEQDSIPSSAAYRHRFGSLVRAYQLIGYTPDVDYAYVEINRHLRSQHPGVVASVVESLRSTGAEVLQDPVSEHLLVNDEWRAALLLCRCLRTEAGASRWVIRFEHEIPAHVTIAVRMKEDNETIKDYYLFPALDVSAAKLRLAEENGALLDAYRFDDLSFFFELARRVALEDAA